MKASQDSEVSNLSFYFKLFNSIKDKSEVELAERELRSLFGPVERVSNFIDEFVLGDFAKVSEILLESNGHQRLQDAITYELPYGGTQGFKGKGPPSLLPKLVRRLAYTREIYALIDISRPVQEILGDLVENANLFLYEKDAAKVIRVITNQFFLEKSAYISKLSRNVQEIDSNLRILIDFFKDEPYRIPATETMAVGRRLQDWFAIREEPSLYLTHYMHPYKGKFHPKMARALINLVCPSDNGIVMDNFSGSGTTLVEAQWLGLEAVGIDINPLSSLMSQVKVQSLSLDVFELESCIEEFLHQLEIVEKEKNVNRSGQATLFSSKTDNSFENMHSQILNLPNQVLRSVPEEQLQSILPAYAILRNKYGKLGENKIYEFLLLGLSGAISDVSRRTSQPFQEVLRGRLYNLWGRLYLSKRLQTTLHARLGSGACFVGDTRDMTKLKTLGNEFGQILDNSIDCIVNSPPYSTALDYIRNDLPQLSILNFADDINSLERNLIGNPNLKIYSAALMSAIRDNEEIFSVLPEFGKDILKKIFSSGREKDAGRVLKFWTDMRKTLSEMCRVLKPGGRAAIVIGDNNIQLEKGSNKFEQIPNIRMIEHLSKEVGLCPVELIGHEIEKSMSGMIRNESIVILEK